MADRNYILGESLKPGWTARLFTKWVADLGGKIGNFFRWGDQSSSQTSTTPTKTVKQQQLQTYNSRYPWFDKEDYLRLEQLVDQKWVTGSKKAQLMDEAYQYYYPQVLNKHKLDERQNVINDWVYNNWEKLANGDQLTNAQYRLLNLTQMAKEKFDLAYNVEDWDIVRNIREKVPNGQELLRNFLSTWDPEILYATWIYDKGQKAQDFRSQKDIAQESLGGNYWKNIWNNMYANSFAPLDAFEKFTYKWLKNLQNLGLKLDDYLAGVAPQSWKDDIMWDMTLEEYRARNKEERETNKKEIDEYIKMVNDANQRNRSNTVNPIVDNYYSRRNFTDLLADWDLEWFFYKWLWDAATNWDMPVVIWASIINPAMWTALMWTNTYVRESEEAYEAMRKAWATHEQAEAGWATVWLLNSLVEIYLDRWLWGTESTTTKGVRDALKKNVLKEVSNKPIEDIIWNAATTYARSSMEEWLEEWVQNTITNAAKMTVEENPEWKDLFEWGRQAFEWWAFNPFNILSPAWDVYSNRESIKQSMMDWAYDAWVTVRNITDMFKGVPKDSGNVWQKVVETTTRNIPEKVVENELKLTPTERKNVERYWITPANFVLKEKIAGLSNADKVVALQDISSDAYNNVTNIFKNVIPQDYRTESKTAWKMLKTMIDTMEKSDIVKEEYADYIAKLKEMLDYSDFSPYEKLAIRRDFDAIVWSDIFWANGRVKWLEDQTIAKWRADLNEEINELWDEFGIDVKSENARIANAITIRDWLLRALSQNKKNNAIWLQDLWIGAILSAWNPVQAWWIIIAKRLLENAAWNIAQGLYNKNNTPLTPSNTKRGAGFIQRAGTNANNNFMISTTSSNNSVNTQEELNTEGIDVWTSPLDTIPDRNVWVNPTDVENWWRTLNNEINENWAVKEMTADEEYQEMVNRIMTPKEVEKIVEMAWNANNLRDFYDGEYNTSLEWLKWEWSDQVEMYAENTLATQRMIEAHPELLDWGTTFSEVLDAYLDWTLTWQSGDSIERMDLSQAEAYTPTKFYEPQELKNAEEVWEEANKKVTKSNKNEVYQARWDFVIDAHNPWFVQELWLTDAEVNKKLRDWAAYPAKAKNLSNRINDWVAAPYRWAWLENSSIVKSITVSDADLEKMVKKVEGNSQEYERKYISNAMLALNTHIDWSPLTFEFVRWNELDRVDQQWRAHNVAGNYNEQTNTIRISRAWQNTVAHEMWHYLDYLRGRQLFGVNVTLSEWGGRNIESLTEDQKKFVKHFDSFMTDLKLSWDSYNEYTMTPTEIFARFVGRFTEWTRNTATNDRFGYESKWYNDKFIEKDYIEFAKILQEKSKLDLANEYANYEWYVERNEQRKWEPKISEQTMSEDELRKREGMQEEV